MEVEDWAPTPSQKRALSPKLLTPRANKRLRFKADQLLEKISKRLDDPPPITTPQSLAHKSFGEMVAESLLNIPSGMVPFCKKLIYDVIYNAELGQLNRGSKLLNSVE